MRIVVLIAFLALAGCGAFRPTFEDCAETPAYAGAKELPPLRVPEGIDAPDTGNALKVPAVAVPEKPIDGRCIDIPPSYGAPRPPNGG
jgi:uncharacterized lipoprotein